MTHASLFSGIGGPEVAAAMLGWENAFHCEINPFGRAVLEYWFPDSVSYEDITKTDFREWRGRIDVLTGGFPCQPFSYAGQRRGHDDDRYLWPEMLRAIDEIRPAWVVGENVAGLATMVEGGVLTDMGGSPSLFDEGDDIHGYLLRQSFTIERICTDLERLGYSVQPVLVPAAAVGAPHRRDRIFILANRHSDDLDRRVSKREVSGTEESESVGYGSRLQYGERSDLRGPLADTNGGDDLRGAGANERESVCEGVQERHEVRESGKSDQVRPAIRRAAENAQRDGCGIGADAVEGNQRDIRDTRAGAVERVRAAAARFSRAAAADTDLQRCPKSVPTTEPGEQDALYNGIVPARLAPGRRWERFPVEPAILRGNDGLPFDVDGLAIPAGKWRTESLKAYGNAIVPQVMYQIFKAIEMI